MESIYKTDIFRQIEFEENKKLYNKIKKEMEKQETLYTEDLTVIFKIFPFVDKRIIRNLYYDLIDTTEIF